MVGVFSGWWVEGLRGRGKEVGELWVGCKRVAGGGVSDWWMWS